VSITLSLPYDDLREGMGFTTRGRTMTEADVVGFAAQTGDWHPQHTDASWASDSVFGERIAHGLLVLSCAVGLLEFDPERVVALRRVSDAVFKRPVRLGDTIHVESTVAGRSEVSDDAGLVALGLRIVNQHDELVIRARTEVLWRRDAVAAESVAAAAGEFVPIPF
jgi:3-hydroxybutyryl-CoA dehydratase